MVINYSEIWNSPVFKIGLIIKLILIALFYPIIQQQWFVPFVVSVINTPTISPWTNFIEQGGDLLSYPYGIVMLLVNLPFVWLGNLVDTVFSIEYFKGFGFRLSLLFADFVVLVVLREIFIKYSKKIIIYYWLSPLLIYILYWYGQIDIIPIAFLMLSLLAIKQNKFVLSAVFIALSISAKISMLIAIPMVLLYLLNNKKFQPFVFKFLLVSSLFIIVFQGFYFLTEGVQEMLLKNREISRVYLFSIEVLNGLYIYLTPLVYMIVLYFVWRMSRINFELLWAMIGVVFFIIILLSFAPMGWFVWLLPFIVIHQTQAKLKTISLIFIFSLLLIFYHFIYSFGATDIFNIFTNIKFNSFNINQIQSLWYTVIFTLGFIILIQMFREGITKNDYYKLNLKPIFIGITGSFNNKKYNLNNLLYGLFGKHSIVEICSNDYYLWNNKNFIKDKVSFFNSRINNLFEFSKDIFNLIQMKTKLAYNGNFLPANNIIIASGMHSLTVPFLRDKMDISIYIDIHKNIENFFHLQTIDKNILKDIQTYIQPQKKYADIVFELLPVPITKESHDRIPRLSLKVQLNSIFYQQLVKMLISICNMHINVEQTESNKVLLYIEGDVSSYDISLVAKKVLPYIDELLDIEPKWQNDMLGIMQLIVLLQLDESLKARY